MAIVGLLRIGALDSSEAKVRSPKRTATETAEATRKMSEKSKRSFFSLGFGDDVGLDVASLWRFGGGSCREDPGSFDPSLS